MWISTRSIRISMRCITGSRPLRDLSSDGSDQVAARSAARLRTRCCTSCSAFMSTRSGACRVLDDATPLAIIAVFPQSEGDPGGVTLDLRSARRTNQILPI